jgi:hypothetical protein
MPVSKEQLLGETEDLLRNVPLRSSIVGNDQNALAWFGRFAAVMRAWNPARAAELLLAQQELGSMTETFSENGYRRMLFVLNEARHTLRLETVGPLSLPLAQGKVFDYFDEVRKIIESAKHDLFFVDPYLDSEFVSRYLSHVSKGVSTRLLARVKLATLLPAAGLFARQSGHPIEVRSAPNFHDRYVFVDRSACYQSGASFKDGAKSAPTTLTQITDAFAAMSQTYEDMWTKARIEPT